MLSKGRAVARDTSANPLDLVHDVRRPQQRERGRVGRAAQEGSIANYHGHGHPLPSKSCQRTHTCVLASAAPHPCWSHLDRLPARTLPSPSLGHCGRPSGAPDCLVCWDSRGAYGYPDAEAAPKRPSARDRSRCMSHHVQVALLHCRNTVLNRTSPCMGSEWLLPFPDLLTDLRTRALRWQDLPLDSSQPLELENLRSLSASRSSAAEDRGTAGADHIAER